ncbi:MAG: hypothetical protein ACFBZ9_13625 [Sphingomonadales bacterium]
MTFLSELSIAAAVALALFVLLSLVIMLRQRAKRRKSIHWFALFVLCAFVGAGTGMGLHLSGTAPVDTTGIDLSLP